MPLSAQARGEDTSYGPFRGTADPGWVEIDVADDVGARADCVERLQLRLLFTGKPGPESMQVKFNGIELHDPMQEEGWWIFPLKPWQMALGRNLLTVRDNRPPATANLIILEKVEVQVQYRPEKTGK